MSRHIILLRRNSSSSRARSSPMLVSHTWPSSTPSAIPRSPCTCTRRQHRPRSRRNTGSLRIRSARSITQYMGPTRRKRSILVLDTPEWSLLPTIATLRLAVLSARLCSKGKEGRRWGSTEKVTLCGDLNAINICICSPLLMQYCSNKKHSFLSFFVYHGVTRVERPGAIFHTEAVCGHPAEELYLAAELRERAGPGISRPRAIWG